MVWTTNKARICQQLITTELELKKVFEHIDSTNSLCQTNYKKKKKEKKVNSNAKVVGVIFFLVVFTSQHIIFVFLPDSLQHCISSRQLVFCQNSFRIFKSFFKMFSLLLASETILLCISIWKTITIPKKKLDFFYERILHRELVAIYNSAHILYLTFRKSFKTIAVKLWKTTHNSQHPLICLSEHTMESRGCNNSLLHSTFRFNYKRKEWRSLDKHMHNHSDTTN